jgi:RNA polymerase sigma-70 factor, ECF subfamily
LNPTPSYPDEKTLTDQEDVSLMQLASGGDANALSLLYDRHAALMYAVLTKKLGDLSDAQDVLHDVFMKLYTKGTFYNPALGKPIAWLLTVAKNAATDKLRKRVTHQKYLDKQMHEVEPSVEAHDGPHGDELDALRTCIDALPNQHRKTLDLAYFSGLTQQEIAKQLGHPLGSVKAWIRRGLIQLKECVEGKL